MAMAIWISLPLIALDRTVSVRLNQNSLPLPVHLTNFTAQSQGDLVQLAWQTQSQTNFAGFQLERSLDAREFIPLNWIPTQPPSAEPLAYGYNDLDLPATASLLYYRLKLVDLDGSSTYSSIRSVHLQDGQLGLLVRGNPVRGPLKLLLSSPLAQSLQLRLISSLGPAGTPADV